MSTTTGLTGEAPSPWAAVTIPTWLRITTLPLVGLACAGLCISMLDVTLASAARHADLPGELERLIYLSEVFAHGTGVIMILLVIGAIQPDRWRQLIPVAASAFVPGVAADVVKLLVQRARPQTLDNLPTDAWESFGGLLGQNWNELVLHNHHWQSFPSAHTATAFGFAFGLAWFYGRGLPIFMVLATLAALQRLLCGAHWPSDLIFGATLACTLSPPVLGWFERRGR